MKMFICSIRDRAVDAFMQPFFVHKTGAAIRDFADQVNRLADDNPLSKHPEDYDLYELGLFDTDTGEFIAAKPRQIAVGKDCVRSS